MAIEAIKTKKELSEAVYGFRASRIILTAFELELFSILGESSLNSAQLAAASATEPRACERLLNALCVLGLLKKAGGRFRNTRISLEYLVAGKPHFLAGLTHSASQWQTWHTLSAAVRRGTALARSKNRRGEEKRRRGFIAAMHERASLQAPRIVGLLDLAAVSRCLDIGAGSGAFAMALARTKKSLQVVAFDLPEVLPLTRAYVRREKLLKQVDFVAGNFNRGGFGSGYDLVLLSAIVHMNDAQQNRRLIARAAAALNPGGQIVIQDFIMEADRVRPAVGAVFALNMLVATAHGDSYTAAEIGGWMRAAGLKKIKKKDTPFDAALMIGWKE
ncbi:MAG: methyltransferase [Chrysiogenia bacterium]